MEKIKKLILDKKRLIGIMIRTCGIVLISLSVKSIFFGSILIWTHIFMAPQGAEIPLIVSAIFICYTLTSLIIFVGGVGLLALKEWARKLIFSVYPIYFLFSVIVSCIFSEGDIPYSLSCNSLIPIFYIALIYFFTRPKVKEQFK